jgi:ribosomal protein S18 acetylase RimI-like enzyme
MIRKAVVEDIPQIKKITEACAQYMIDQGIYQWNKNYPSLEVLTKDVKANNVYVYLVEQKIVGTVMFSMEMDDFYTEVNWLTPNFNQLYVHRLAVHPHYQKHGIARALMDFGEALAKEKKCLSIRLDTFSKNPRNNRFYQARQYQQVGQVFFSQKSEHPFYCYEKLLTKR